MYNETYQDKTPNQGKSTASYNTLVFIIMDVDISQNILKTATTSYLDRVVDDYKNQMIGLNLGFTLAMGILIYILIHYLVLWPIREL